MTFPSTPEESFPFPCLAGVPCRWPDCECQVKAGANAGFFAIGCSDETGPLWLSGFDGGINGVWTKDPQKALVFIHKRDANQLISMPGLAAYRPFCQWIPQNAEPQSPKTSDGTERNESPVVAALPECKCVFCGKLFSTTEFRRVCFHCEASADPRVQVPTNMAAKNLTWICRCSSGCYQQGFCGRAGQCLANAAPQPEAKHMHRGIDEAAVAAPDDEFLAIVRAVRQCTVSGAQSEIGPSQLLSLCDHAEQTLLDLAAAKDNADYWRRKYHQG